MQPTYHRSAAYITVYRMIAYITGGVKYHRLIGHVIHISLQKKIMIWNAR